VQRVFFYCIPDSTTHFQSVIAAHVLGRSIKDKACYFLRVTDKPIIASTVAQDLYFGMISGEGELALLQSVYQDIRALYMPILNTQVCTSPL
jgi:hypothetical protein